MGVGFMTGREVWEWGVCEVCMGEVCVSVRGSV